MRLPRPLLDQLARHAQESYPRECCGVLLGRPGLIETLHPCRNTSTEPHDHQMDPQDQLQAEEEARRQGLEVLGFYHSHPDHPPVPSPKTDKDTQMAQAWPQFLYLIIAIEKGQPGEARAWRWNTQRGRFEEERLQVK